jgi:excisionase family DNA binding protein
MPKPSNDNAQPQDPGARRERISTLRVSEVDLVDAETLAVKMGVGRTTILRFAREGKIPYYAIGRAWFFCEKEVLASLRRFGGKTAA